MANRPYIETGFAWLFRAEVVEPDRDQQLIQVALLEAPPLLPVVQSVAEQYVILQTAVRQQQIDPNDPRLQQLFVPGLWGLEVILDLVNHPRRTV